MYIGLGHLAAFVCELAVLAARGIEGAGVAAITALVSSAFFVSVGLVRAWPAKPETYAPWDTQPQSEPPVDSDKRF
jgi:hypothetical protein